MDAIEFIVNNLWNFIVGLFVISMIIGFVYALIDTVRATASERRHRPPKKLTEKEMEKLEKKRIKAGSDFENETASVLGKAFNAEPLRNLLIPTKDGENTEVDMAFVTEKGIIAVECKEKGRGCLKPTDDTVFRIRGAGEDWAFSMPNDIVNEKWMENPIDQNAYHLNAMKELCEMCGMAYSGTNLVAVNGRFYYPRIQGDITSERYDGFMTVPDGNAAVVRITDDQKKARKKVKEWYESLPDVYSYAQMVTIRTVFKNREADETALQAHRARVATAERRRKEEEERVYQERLKEYQRQHAVW